MLQSFKEMSEKCGNFTLPETVAFLLLLLLPSLFICTASL